MCTLNTSAQDVFNKVYNDFSYTFYNSFHNLSYYNNEGFETILNTLDGNLILVGASESNSILGDSNNNVYLFLSKIKPRGETIWTQNLDLTFGDEYGGVQYQYSDSSFVLVGLSDTSATGQLDQLGFLMFLDKNGNYEKHFGFDFGRDTRFYEAKTNDEGRSFDVIGTTDISSTSQSVNYQPFIMRIDSAGNILNQFYGTDFGSRDFFYDLVYKDNGNLVIASGKIDSTESFSDPYIVEIDSHFNLVWEYFNPIGINNTLSTRESLEIVEDGLVFCGWEGNFSNTQPKVTKIDFQGNIIWETKMELGRWANSYDVLRKTHDGHFITVGLTDNPLIEDYQSISRLTKISDSGEIIWTRNIAKYQDSEALHFVYDLVTTPDKGFAYCGYVINNYIHTDSIFHRNDAWVVKTDSCGYTKGDFPTPLFVIDSIVNLTVYLSNLSENYCSATLDFGNGDSQDIYAYSQWTNGANYNQLQYTYPKEGDYTIRMIATAADVTRHYELTLSLPNWLQNLNDIQVTVFPNPAIDCISIIASHPSHTAMVGNNVVNQSFNCTIISINGQIVKSFSIDPNQKQQIDVSNIPNGVYILTINYQNVPLGIERICIIK